MKTCKRIFSIMLVVVLVVSMFTTVTVSAATPGAAKITNATQNSSKQLVPGVRYTQLQAAAGKYHSSAAIQFDVVEIDMSTQNLYIDTAYGADKAIHAWQTGDKIISRFQSKNSGLTPVAAINADLWWLYTGKATEPASGGQALHNSSGQTLGMSLGFSMSNGEIYTSDRMLQENFWGKNSSGATVNLPYEDYISFGITSDNVPVISNPNAQVSIKNTTKGTGTLADGINRLPAYNTLVMYTDKGCENHYANDDAYEVKIKITSTADYVIKHGTKISGKVESVHPKGTSGPTMGINSNYIILTARGTRYDSISNYKVGDNVEIGVSVYDQSGKYTTEWQKVTDAIAGHYPFATDGVASSNQGANKDYPASFIGITKDNNVMMFTLGGTDGSRKGTASSSYVQIAKDLNLKDCFMLDGGGSSQLYLPDNGEYKQVNKCCEPTRALLNMLILSTGPSRGAQGTVPSIPAKTANAKKIDFSNKANLTYLSGTRNDTVVDIENNAVKLTSISGNDPYVTLDYSLSSPVVSSNKYKYLTIEYMLPTSNKTQSRYSSQIYYKTTASSSQYRRDVSGLIRDGKYHTVVIDFSTMGARWKGNLSSLRLDYLATCGAGDVMYIKSLTFTETAPSTSSGQTSTPTPDPIVSANPTAKPNNSATVKPGVTPSTKPNNSTKPSASASTTQKPTSSSGVVDPAETDVVTDEPTIDEPAVDEPADDEDDGKKNDPTNTIIIICCAAVVVVVVAIVILYIVFNKKK